MGHQVNVAKIWDYSDIVWEIILNYWDYYDKNYLKYCLKHPIIEYSFNYTYESVKEKYNSWLKYDEFKCDWWKDDEHDNG